MKKKVELHQIQRRKNRIFKAKRRGRGYGSGVGGHTVGRGQKGQRSRTGEGKKIGFEGGNVPLYRRLPKFRGFRNPTRKEYQPVNLSDVEKRFSEGDVVSLETLREKRMVRKGVSNVKILAKGSLSKKLSFERLPLSEKARSLIEKAGGTVN
ncbi:MAG: 50S ribosomal protein L15 [Candidatus Dojkabacteria bacterium]|nr:50S ribosomal protein L15 [Candidatus Dojkabacteria bacterium]